MDSIPKRYRIEGLLGEGGAGRVWRVRDELTGKSLALKVLHAGGMEAGRELLRKEFILLASHSHPHLVQVFDYGYTREGHPYFTMELCEGPDLVSFLRARASTEAETQPFVTALEQVLEALDHIHARGLVHRDLKPRNIIAGGAAGAPHVKLIDFGFAKPPGAAEEATSGTIEYLAPEVLRGGAAGRRADLYAFGAILYEIFAGRPPFSGADAAKVVQGHLYGEPDLSPVPESYRPLVSGLLAKDPAERIPSAYQAILKLPGREGRRRIPLPPFAAVFVDREEELKRLESAARAAVRREGRFVLVAGPAASGKTRLLRELELRLELEGIAVHRETAAATGSAPGGLLRKVVRRLELALAEQSPRARECARLLFRLDENVRSAKQGVEGLEAQRELLLDQAATLLWDVACDAPYVLLVDDLQWADTLTLEVLGYLQRKIEEAPAPPLTVVAAARNEESADRTLLEAFSEELGSRSCERIELEGFDEEAIARYLEEVLGPGSCPEDFPRSLRVDTGGLPGFVEEYLRLRIQVGGVEKGAEGWRIDPAREIPVPQTFEELAAKRIQRLGDLRRRILGWAAVLDRPFSLEEVANLIAREDEAARASRESTPEPPSLEASSAERQADRARADEHSTGTGAVARALELCVLDQLLRRSGDRFGLPHAAMRKAAYESIPEDERRRRHRLAAEMLLEGGEAEASMRIEEIARHFFFSDEPERALPYLVRAGRTALCAGALREAASHFTHALEIAEDPELCFEILLERESVWGLLGRPDLRAEDVGAIEELAARSASAEKLREALVRRGLFLDAQGRKREALGRLEEALAHAGAGAAVRSKLLARTGMLRLFLGELQHAREDIGEALRLARQCKDRPREAECLQLLGLSHYLEGAYERALIEMQRAADAYRDLGDVQRAGALESNMGLIHFDRGELEAAEEKFQTSLKTFRQSGYRRGEAVDLLNLGLVASEMGFYERALSYMTEALRIRREVGDRHGEGADLGNLGSVWARLGRFERATPLLEEAIAIARRSENRISEAVNECRLGLVSLARGERDAARSRLERAWELIRDTGNAYQRVFVLAALARLECENDPARALEYLARAQELARGAGMRAWRIECLTLEAAARLEQGALAGAEKTSRAAVEELERYPSPLERSQEVWFVRYRVLEALRRRGEVAEEEPERALRRAYTLLREKADRIEDPDLRRSFLENIPLHREINRLHEELQRRMRREARLRERSFYEIARTLHGILDLDPLLDRLLELAIETTHAEKGLILLRDEDGRFTIRAARGMARESVEDAAEICRSVIDDVARGGEPVLAVDAPSDERFRERRSIISFQIRTLMCAPLKVRGEVIGAVYVDGRGGASFSAEDLDYLVSFAQLAAVAVDNARLLSRLRRENLYLRREVEGRTRFENIVGSSEAMEKVLALLEKVARTNASVLLTGETGTGKAVIARAIHYASTRRDRPFVTVDCGALPETLLESELFGHKRGAFSGAVADRIGLIEEAEGGTLFLDEITNTSPELQAKLLRVLQEGEIRRVGENQVRKVDVRIVAATNTDIRRAVAEGRFREDLYYRLNVVTIDLPPLRERREDIPLLAVHFLKRSAERQGKPVRGFTEEAMRLLESAPWRGNVRELENLIEKAVILCEGEVIDAPFVAGLLGLEEETRGRKRREDTAAGDDAASGSLTLSEFDRRWLEAERRYLLDLVERAGWNLSQAARLAGVRNRNSLISRLKKHGISRPGSDGGRARRA